MARGDAVQRIEVPSLDATFQSEVRGLFIVGELGGRGLIKNAINEGKIAVEWIARELASSPSRSDEGGDVVDVAIVGAGPAGLSAGLEALRAGLSYTILEQGSIADSIRKYPRHKILLAEPIAIPLYGDLWIADSSKEALLQVWETIIANTGLRVLTGHRVENVAREGECFLLAGAGRTLRARRVVLALGRRGTPRRLGVPGEERENVFYDIVEMETFRGRRVLVVGGGDSALESALGLANQEGTQVVLSHRGDAFERAKQRNRDKLRAAIASGRIEPLMNSRLLEIGPGSVSVDVGGARRPLAIDDVIVRIGGELPSVFLERIGVRLVKKEIRIADSPEAAAEHAQARHELAIG
jgi:thioredoxin reductase